MKIEIAFIRNGNTELAQDGKFTGSLDVPLSEEGANEITNRNNNHKYPEVSRVYTGLSRRCRETTTLIYGRIPALIAYEMRSLDMGGFEGKSYDEVRVRDDFIKWASSGTVNTVPDGGSPHESLSKNISSFRRIIRDLEAAGISSASIIAERMSIQMLLASFAYPRSKYCGMHIPHGGGCTATCDSRSGIMRIKGII